MASETELAAMRQAIMLSALGLGTTSPSPPVGCVILDAHGRVAGTGFHRRKGEAHAEVNALNAAGNAARGGTAVVTLEPCNHVGLTPACRQALLGAGVIRVVIGVLDPTSYGDGGAAVLTAAGVDVETGVLRDEVLTVLRPWLTATSRGEPHVTWAYAVGADDEDTNASVARALRSTVDLILTDAVTDEGIPGGHNDQHLRLGDLSPAGKEPVAWLRAAHEAGVRSILLSGRSRVATALQAADAVDDLIVTVPRGAGIDLTTFATVTSASFAIVDITGWNGYLSTRFRRSHSEKERISDDGAAVG